MTVTIKDVAARAGVSPKTVSRVMNGEQHVRPAVREAVMRVVDELGYRPNAFARSLSSARSYLIGLFFDDPASGYATAMQRGAMARCREQHYHLVVEPIDFSSSAWIADLAGAAQALRLDGIVLPPPVSQHSELLDRLDDLGILYVTVSPDEPARARAGWVAIDEQRAAFEMTEHLIRLGHREIGFVEGDRSHASAASRLAGFRAAMMQAALPIPAGRIVEGDFSFRAGLSAGESLLAHAPLPTAIFASNDDMALGVSIAAIKQGVSVPEQLSIAGFDDAPTARLAWPAISTVRQPVADMGAAAIDILADPAYRADPDAPRFRRVLDYEIVARDSTVAPGRA